MKFPPTPDFTGQEFKITALEISEELEGIQLNQPRRLADKIHLKDWRTRMENESMKAESTNHKRVT